MPLDKARHNSAPEVFGNRATFQAVPDPACLFVNEVHRNDVGVYRCRVDFRNSATKSFRYNLSVIGKCSQTPNSISFIIAHQIPVSENSLPRDEILDSENSLRCPLKASDRL